MKTCSECGSSVETRRENIKYTECGLDNVILVGVEVRRCHTCKGSELVLPRIDELHRVLARSVAKAKGRLTGKEIRFLRKYLGYSGNEAAEALGVAPETLSRWENGRQPMEVPTERLLRFMVFNQKPAESLPPDDLIALAGASRDSVDFRLESGSKGWRTAPVS